MTTMSDDDEDDADDDDADADAHADADADDDHVVVFAHRACLRMLRIRPTAHESALSKVVEHLLHRRFLRNCTAAATRRSVQQAVEHCFRGFTSVV